MELTTGELRNITTGILHTEIGDVYLFFEKYLGCEGIMTHQIPSACRHFDKKKKKKNPNAFLTLEKVKLIRDLHKQGNLNQRQLGEAFGVSHRTISMIVNNKLWKNVSAA